MAHSPLLMEGALVDEDSLLSRALAFAARGWAVFPLLPGTKNPFQDSHCFKDATQDPAVVRRWWNENPTANIGIATGSPSNIFVVDVDVKSVDGAGSLKALEEKHAPLPPTYTVQTQSNGRHYYFRLHGAAIRNSAGTALGLGIDVRGDGGYVVAPPSVVNGRAYKVLNGRALANPPEWLIGLLCRGVGVQPNSCISTSLQPCISASLHNTPSLHNFPSKVLGNITAKVQAENALTTKHPQLLRLYGEFIEPRFQAMPGTRNDFIVHAVPFLYRVVAAPIVLDLVACFYNSNRSLFSATIEHHMKEAATMLKSVTNTYLESLNSTEREIYTALPERERAAFRICRDLAQRPPGAGREPLTFFLSFCHLADRLGLQGMQAQRIMRQFESYGLIKLVKKGTRRAAGVRGEAGTYQWVLT